MKTYLLSLLLLLPCIAAAQNNVQHRKDSLRNVIATTEGKEKLDAYYKLTMFYFTASANDDRAMDTLLIYYREFDAEALRQENYKTQGTIRINTLGAYMNRNQFDETIKLAPEYLEYLKEREVWQQYYAVYQKLLQAYMRKGDYDKSLEEAKKMYDEAKQRGHDDGRGIALYQMSYLYGNMSRVEEEVKYMKESIEILKNVDDMLWLVSMAHFRLCNALLNLQHYDEVLQYAQDFEKVNYRYEEASKSKQLSSWQNLWRIYLSLYVSTEDYDKAETYCYKLENSNGGPAVQYSVYQARAKIYHARKQYAKALEMAEKALEMCGGDPDCTNGNLATKIWILCSMRGVDDIHEMFVQSTTMRDSLRNTKFNAQLDELRTEYEVDKITAENEINRLQKIRNRNYFLFALCGCALLAIALGIWIYYSRTIVRKNRGLYLQIKEQDRLAEDLEREREESRKLRRLVQSEATGLPEDDDDIFFERLTVLMKEQKLYTNSEIKRQDIAGQIGLSDRRLHDCVKDNTGMSFTDYINSLRLAHSRELLSRLDENLTIEAIALDSGFNSRVTFYRLFNEKYGLSPKQFREFVK